MNHFNLISVCFALDSPNSLANVEHKWSPELQSHCRRGKLLLVGLKKDLRQSKTCIDAKEAKQVAKRINADGYVECSAMTQDGLYEVFDLAIRMIFIRSKYRKKRKSVFSWFSKKKWTIKKWNNRKCSITYRITRHGCTIFFTTEGDNWRVSKTKASVAVLSEARCC